MNSNFKILKTALNCRAFREKLFHICKNKYNLRKACNNLFNTVLNIKKILKDKERKIHKRNSTGTYS